MTKKWNMIVDIERCNNCRGCFMAVKDEHTGNHLPGYAAQRTGHQDQPGWDIERKERGTSGSWMLRFVQPCVIRCDNRRCVKVYWNAAITKRADGIVVIDPVKAKGQKEIVDACPYGGKVNEESQLPQAWIFDAHLLDAGFAKPRIESQCPTDVFQSLKVSDTEMQELVVTEELEVLQPELGTKPRVYYKNMHFFTKCFVGGSVVAMVDGVEECVEGAEVVVKKDSNEVGRTTTDAFGTPGDPSFPERCSS